VAGTTRDWLSAEIEIDGIIFVLVDTAGEGPAADELAEDVRRIARDQESSAQISMLVVDASEGADAAFLTRPRPGTTLVVLNKKDLAAAADTDETARLLPDSRIVRTSALTGEGLDELRRAMAEAVKSGLVPGGAHHTALSSRQRRMLREARLALERGTVSCGRGLDLAASDIRDALTALGSVLGWGATEEILDAIFRDFCIGK
jgi:tRNA modification GTPase